MKTVKIPNCMNPFEVIVNNHRYRYPGGTTQEVPDEVAEVIEVHMKNHADMTAPPYVPESGGGVVGTCKLKLVIDGYETPYGDVVLVDGNNTTIDLGQGFGTTEYEIPCGTVILIGCDFASQGTNLTRVPFNGGGGTVTVYQAPAEANAEATLRVYFGW